MSKVSVKIGGHAGEGIISAGEMLSRTLSRGGYNVFSATDYPSLIRGGDNTFYIRAEDEEVNTHIKTYDIFIALSKNSYELHKNEVNHNGIIIHDSTFKADSNGVRPDIDIVSAPLTKIAKKQGTVLMRNTVALSVAVGLMSYDLKKLEDVIKDVFKKKDKPKKIIKDNINAAREGHEWINNNYDCDNFKIKLPVLDRDKKLLITGNEAISLGAIKAGCKFISAYPMTPATSIMEYMASHEYDYDIVIKQTEDELAACTMAIGANVTGVRAMTATSGGGFALMNEALSLAGIIETPLVAVEVQRGGPSTGLPTHTEQGDLKFVIHAGHGEFPKIVMAPGNMEEAFEFTFNAFNIAEKYQLPVIILSDKYLSMSYKTVKPFKTDHLKIDRGKTILKKEIKGDYKRFKNTSDGVSPRAIPGTKGGVHRVTGNEHDEYGRLTEESNTRTMMMDKRYRKLEHAFKDLPEPELWGEKNAQITIVCYGSMFSVAKDAVKFLKNDGITANILHIKTVWPLHEKQVTKYLNETNQTIVIENNKTAQLSKLITEFTGIKLKNHYLRYDGRPIFPGELTEHIRGMI